LKQKRTTLIRLLNALVFLLVLSNGEYNGHNLLNTWIYTILFNQSFAKMPYNYEIIAVVLAIPVWLKAASASRSSPLGSDLFRMTWMPALILAGATLVAVGVGVAGGGAFRITQWQIRSHFLYLFWPIVAFHACTSVDDAMSFLDSIAKAAVVKSCFNIYAFFVLFGGNVRAHGYEYISCHIDSLYLGTGLLTLLIKRLYLPQEGNKYWSIAGILLVAYAWVENDRRVSFLGVTFAVLFSAGFLYPYISKRHYRYIGAALGVSLLFVAATWNNPQHSIKSLFVKDPTQELDYRDIENYNMYRAIAENPVIGRGYGFPFKHYMELPNIFFSDILSWIPHNSILFNFAYAGSLGISALGLVIMTPLAVIIRLFHTTTVLRERIFCFLAFCIIVQTTLYYWADMAINWGQSLMLPCVVTGYAARLLLLHVKKGHNSRAIKSQISRRLTTHG
jgi:hypothetical protein